MQKLTKVFAIDKQKQCHDLNHQRRMQKTSYEDVFAHCYSKEPHTG